MANRRDRKLRALEDQEPTPEQIEMAEAVEVVAKVADQAKQIMMGHLTPEQFWRKSDAPKELKMAALVSVLVTNHGVDKYNDQLMRAQKRAAERTPGQPKRNGLVLPGGIKPPFNPQNN